MIIKSKSPKKTKEIAGRLAVKLLVKHDIKHSIVVALEGELGAGKTQFTKGFAKALGVKQSVTSPTFVLMKPYKIKRGTLYHIDAYRLKDHRDLITLGVGELIKDRANILLIEWSDRVKKILPKKYTKVHIDHLDKTSRKISITM